MVHSDDYPIAQASTNGTFMKLQDKEMELEVEGMVRERSVPRVLKSAKARRVAIIIAIALAVAIVVISPLVYCRVTCDCPIFREQCGAREIMLGMGRGFYLPDTVLTEDNTGTGNSLFTDISPKCVVDEDVNENGKEFTYFENTDSFSSTIATECALSGFMKVKGVTLTATLGIASTSIDKTTLEMKGMRLRVYTRTGSSEIKDECLTSNSDGLEMKDEFIKDFESLPADVTEPHKMVSWQQYNDILHTYGSHITKKIYHGSKLTNYVFSKSSQSISEDELKMTACAGVKEANISVCGGYTSTDYSDVKEYETSQDITVLGGAVSTRAKLTNDITAELLEQLMVEAKVTRQAIEKQYYSIWDMLKARYSNTEHYVKAVNLENYYIGFLNTGCDYLEEGGTELRKFVLVDMNINNGQPVYECQLRSVGCRSDDDCHLEGANWWCACYGSTCVREAAAEKPYHSVAESREIQTTLTGGKSESANEFCVYQAGPWCKCNSDGVGQDWETVWRIES